MDLKKYRNSELEKKRISDLMKLLPNNGESALDVGARDGYISTLLTNNFGTVIALDLEKPFINHPKVYCIKGDATNLEFADNSFDLVFCAEVLEHIPTHLLCKACSELSRVAKTFLIIGVPYKQDIRVGRTTCCTCGKNNPPWGHVNRFDENQIKALFPIFEIKKLSFVGYTNARTNIVSAFLMDIAKNPYGFYSQEVSCIYCGAKLKSPTSRNFLQ